MKRTILVVDAATGILAQACWVLRSDFEVLTTSNELEARTMFAAANPPVVLINLSLDQEGTVKPCAGINFLQDITSGSPATRVIVFTANEEDDRALQALRLGAFDCQFAPVQIEDLKAIVRRGFHIYALHQRLQRIDQGENADFHGMIGKSNASLEVFRLIKTIADSKDTVLLFGENGTGKSLVAQTIYSLSRRPSGPFMVVGCKATPQTLLESQLFGHKTGIFGGAFAQTGKFVSAHQGTLFLDEIDNLSPAIQAKLLRFCQDKRTGRSGKGKATDLDVRIIAATNRDLNTAIEIRIFFEEHLNARILEIPPLRQRKDDIVPLAQYFAAKTCRELHKPALTLSVEAQGALLMHSWPGNVRELENLVTRAVTLCPGSTLSPGDFGFSLNSVQTDVNLKFAKKAIESDFIKKALLKNNGVVSRAAKDLGISRVNLYELMDRYSIQIQDFKTVRAQISDR